MGGRVGVLEKRRAEGRRRWLLFVGRQRHRIHPTTEVDTHDGLMLHVEELLRTLLGAPCEHSQTPHKPRSDIPQRSWARALALRQQEIAERAGVDLVEVALADAPRRQQGHEQLVSRGHGRRRWPGLRIASATSKASPLAPPCAHFADHTPAHANT